MRPRSCLAILCILSSAAAPAETAVSSAGISFSRPVMVYSPITALPSTRLAPASVAPLASSAFLPSFTPISTTNCTLPGVPGSTSGRHSMCSFTSASLVPVKSADRRIHDTFASIPT